MSDATRAPTHLLHQLVAVERATHTIGSDGGSIATWHTHLASVPARVEPIATRFALAGAEPSPRRMRVYVDRAHDITPRDRLVHAGITLRIIDTHDLPDVGLRVLVGEEKG